MWVWVKLLLSPSNWMKAISLISTGLELARAFVLHMRKRAQEKKLEQIRESVKRYDEANAIADDEERLKKKAEAACAIEKHLNPHADC